MNDLLFSICIPVRNDPDNLKQCLSGFRKQDLSDCEIIVCDDGSTPPISSADLSETGVPFTLIRQVGQGPSAARNHMARLARGTYLFFVDADTVPHVALLESAKLIIAEHPDINVFYGSYDDEPEHRTLISSYKNLLHHHTHHHSAITKERVTTFWCGCGVIRREIYLTFGGLSEFYDKPSIEDIELGTRLSAQHICIRIFPQLQVKHLKKWTLKSWLHTDLFRRGIPWVRLMRAKKNWNSQLNFSWSQRIACLAAIGVIACIPLAIVTSRFALTALLPSLIIFLIPNASFLQLVRRKRGLLTSMAIIPLHVIYSLICVASVGVAFFYPRLKPPPSGPLLAKGRNASN